MSSKHPLKNVLVTPFHRISYLISCNAFSLYILISTIKMSLAITSYRIAPCLQAPMLLQQDAKLLLRKAEFEDSNISNSNHIEYL